MARVIDLLTPGVGIGAWTT